MPNAAVRVQQTKHKFAFGSAYQTTMLAASQYRSLLFRYFNQATVENDLKWIYWLPSNRAATQAGIDDLNNSGLKVKGHTLLYPKAGQVPDAVASLPAADIPEAVRAHIEEELGYVGDTVIDWDVVNEPVSSPGLLSTVGNNNQLLRQSFEWAHQYAPAGTRLFVNEIGLGNQGNAANPTADPYYVLVKWMVDNGVPFEGVGLQGHLAKPFVPPPQLWDVFDAFSALGKAVQITELDVNTTDQQLQAEVLRLVMKAGFSHPGMDGITLWGFWQGAHWRPDAALFNYDYSPKPAGIMLETLLRDTWWSDEPCTTDAQGQCQVSVFLGNHTVSVSEGTRIGEQAVTVGAAGATTPVTVVIQ